jgi:hypothetical protein
MSAPPEYRPTPKLQRIWSPTDARDTVRDAVQLGALKWLHQQVNSMTVWDSIVAERALLGTLPKPVVSLTSIDKLMADWPAPIICGLVIP